VSGAWQTVQFDLATIALDVSCTSVGHCICPVGENGVGSRVIHTDDGGKSWVNEPTVPELMYLGGDQCGNNVVISATFTMEYNQGGANGTYNFVNANVPGGFSSQNVQCTDPYTFYATGARLIDPNSFGGVDISRNGGANFSYVPATGLLTLARYGAFPSANIWYLTAGSWPQSTESAEGVRHLSARLSTYHDGNNLKNIIHPEPRKMGSGDGAYTAQIVKTTDGGKTWKTVFFQNNTFYFNQIACGSVSNCVAVGEAFSDSTSPGIRIWTTADAGKTWTQTHFSTDTQASLMSAYAMTSNEYWVGGGNVRCFSAGCCKPSV
jgi:hypothetical protein